MAHQGQLHSRNRSSPVAERPVVQVTTTTRKKTSRHKSHAGWIVVVVALASIALWWNLQEEMVVPVVVPQVVSQTETPLVVTKSIPRKDPVLPKAASKIPPVSSSTSESSTTTTETDHPIQIAHAISLITCHKASRVQGFLDALIILRHSIHQNSVHAGKGRYSYQMYAIIHEEGGCDQHVPLLKRLGYIPVVKPTPVDWNDLPEGWYKSHVESENCCGSKEFIKLYGTSTRWCSFSCDSQLIITAQPTH